VHIIEQKICKYFVLPDRMFIVCFSYVYSLWSGYIQPVLWITVLMNAQNLLDSTKNNPIELLRVSPILDCIETRKWSWFIVRVQKGLQLQEEHESWIFLSSSCCWLKWQPCIILVNRLSYFSFHTSTWYRIFQKWKGNRCVCMPGILKIFFCFCKEASPFGPTDSIIHRKKLINLPRTIFSSS
jgi:hypothetical protein